MHEFSCFWGESRACVNSVDQAFSPPPQNEATEYVAVKTFSRFLGWFSWPQSPLGSFRVDYKVNIALKEGRHPAKAVSN